MRLVYRRNLNGIPETTKREMYKKAYIDRWPELAKSHAMEGTFDEVITARYFVGYRERLHR